MASAERRRELFLRGFEKVASMGYDITIRNSEHFNVLTSEPQNPAVVYFNHLAQDDPLIVVTLLERYAPERLMNVVMPISETYTHFGKFMRYWAITNVGKAFAGFSMPPIVQSYRRRGEAGEHNDETKSFALDRKLMGLLWERLQTGCLAIISPEGHRSDTGALLPAEEGAGAAVVLLKRLKDRGKIENGYVLPMGIVMEKFMGPRLHYNVRDKAPVTVTIGKPMEVDDILSDMRSGLRESDRRRASHYLMEVLTGLLPEHMHGVYAKDLLADAYAGRFELRMEESGKVYVYDSMNSEKHGDGA